MNQEVDGNNDIDGEQDDGEGNDEELDRGTYPRLGGCEFIVSGSDVFQSNCHECRSESTKFPRRQVLKTVGWPYSRIQIF